MCLRAGPASTGACTTPLRMGTRTRSSTRCHTTP